MLTYSPLLDALSSDPELTPHRDYPPTTAKASRLVECDVRRAALQQKAWSWGLMEQPWGQTGVSSGAGKRVVVQGKVAE